LDDLHVKQPENPQRNPSRARLNFPVDKQMRVVQAQLTDRSFSNEIAGIDRINPLNTIG
jgi:hypothetical protein